MAPRQSITFLVPASETTRVVSAIRENFSNCLIGRKPHDGDSMLLAVTLYAESVEAVLQRLSALGSDTTEFGAARPSPGTLSDLIAEIKRKQA
jgi:hypothetical protein